ncbi:hypothetical protein AQ610_23030 [Burkholderia humptydooensis]|nr:hypothetical protein AQ610_23030 [Burkholderia humptydooensis]
MIAIDNTCAILIQHSLPSGMFDTFKISIDIIGIDCFRVGNRGMAIFIHPIKPEHGTHIFQLCKEFFTIEEIDIGLMRLVIFSTIVTAHKFLRGAQHCIRLVLGIREHRFDAGDGGGNIDLFVGILREYVTHLGQLSIDFAVVRLPPFTGRRDQFIALVVHQGVKAFRCRAEFVLFRLNAFQRFLKNADFLLLFADQVDGMVNAFDHNFFSVVALCPSGQHVHCTFEGPFGGESGKINH